MLRRSSFNMNILIWAVVTTILGISIGFFGSISKTNISSPNGMSKFDWLILLCVLFVFCILIFDIITILYKRRNIGKKIFKIDNLRKQKDFLIILIIITLFLIIFYFIKPSFVALYAVFLVGLNTILFGYHSFLQNGINVNGIALWGNYYQWKSIKSYNWVNNSNILVFKVVNKFLFFKYNQDIRCSINLEQKTEIEDFLNKYIV